MDAFWVEATEDEAGACIFPLMQPQQIAESRQLAEKWSRLAERLGNPARPYCFLVARDLSSIVPFHPHYPFHQLWNAYSPFKSMPEMTITDLTELHGIVLPPIEATGSDD